MSFAIWIEEPPFVEADLSPNEKIIKVGDVWVVTNQPELATPEKVAEILSPAVP